jgi:3-phosphoshikimate 1-carboxyvinyltransferase
VSKIINKFPEGVVTPPPSKSISHRAIICAALSGGDRAVRRVKNVGVSEDIDATRRGMETIVSTRDGSGVIDCGESGSTLRFLIPIAGIDGRDWTFRGSKRLLERPLSIYEDVFSRCAGIFESGAGAVRVRGPLRPGTFEVPGDVSSQFISGLLMALPMLDGDSEIMLTSAAESAGYVGLTLDVMASFGVRVDEIGEGDDGVGGFERVTGWRVPGGQSYKSVKYKVEADWSQAAFFLCAGALGRRVIVDGLSPGSLQSDMRILSILDSAGCDVSAEMRALRRSCSFRALAPRSGLKAVNVDVRDIPDLAPPVAALACCLEGESHIRNAGRLRLKESDRFAALITELSGIGADIRGDSDSIIIKGRSVLKGGAADAHGDHRIAMALAVASIRCESPVELTGWESVSKSYPNFWHDFGKSDGYEEG